MKVIDTHAHAFPDFIAEDAISQLVHASNSEFPPCHDGTVSGLLNEMNKAGVETSVVCSIATKPGQTESILIWSSRIRSPRIEPLPSVHPGNRDIPEIIKKIDGEGFKGIKLHPMYQDFEIDSERVFPIYESAREHDLLIEFHAGYDIAFPNNENAAPERIAVVLDTFPGLRIFATHFGGWKSWYRVKNELAGKDLILGTSFTVGDIEPELFYSIYNIHGADRICFATDSPWKGQADEIENIKGLELADSEKEKIFYSNAKRVFRL